MYWADARMDRIARSCGEYTTQIGHRPAPSGAASRQDGVMALFDAPQPKQVVVGARLLACLNPGFSTASCFRTGSRVPMLLGWWTPR